MELTWVESVQIEAEEEKVSEDQFARFDKLIVYGRFEEHDDEDENGSFVQHEEVQQLLQVSMANRGTSVVTEQCIWVKGRLVMSRMVSILTIASSLIEDVILFLRTIAYLV